jgi:uncharacterized delta-60 repeat protein
MDLRYRDGKIVLGGYTNQGGVGYDFMVARFNTDGSLDTSFDGDGIQAVDFGSYADFAYGVALQADGKIVVAGNSYQNDTTGDDFAVARLNPDGSLDVTFGNSGKVTTDLAVTALDRHRDSARRKIVVAGESYQNLMAGTSLVTVGTSNSPPSAAAHSV